MPAERVINTVNEGPMVATSSLSKERSGAGAGVTLLGSSRRPSPSWCVSSLSTECRPPSATTCARQSGDRSPMCRSMVWFQHSFNPTSCMAQVTWVTQRYQRSCSAKSTWRCMNTACPCRDTTACEPKTTGKARDDGWWQDAFLYARAFTIAGGSNEVLRNVIAERALGLPKG